MPIHFFDKLKTSCGQFHPRRAEAAFDSIPNRFNVRPCCTIKRYLSQIQNFQCQPACYRRSHTVSSVCWQDIHPDLIHRFTIFGGACQTNQFEKTSAALAKNIEAEIKAIGQNSRGLKTKINASGKDWFGWLRQVECPAVLCEGAFLDSSDSQIISTFEKQAQFGIAYAKGVLKQLGIAWKPDGSSGQNEPSPGTFKAGEEVTGKGTYYATADGTGSKGTTNGLTGKVYKTAYPKPYPVNINKIGWFQDRDVTVAAAGTGKFKTGDAVTGKGIYYAAADGTGSKGSTDGVIGKVYKTAYPNPYPVNIDKLGWFRDSDVKLSTQRDNPYSKPTRSLRRGSEGSQVKWAQWALVNAGYGVGKYGVDGVFGEETEKAVRSFQKANGLSVDGEVGPDTVAKLA